MKPSTRISQPFGLDLIRPARFCLVALALGQVEPDSVSSTGAPAVKYTTAPIEVTAARPFSAATDETFRAADFALRPKNSSQDILRVVPGLVIAQHAGGGKAEQIYLRGFDSDHGTDVSITVDDAPVNMVSHGHGQGYADLHFVIPELVERVDVAKGPYFARYGDFATAGSVGFRTVERLDGSLIKVEAGADNTVRSVALIDAPMANPNMNAFFGAELYSSDGYFEAPQDFERVNLYSKLRSATGGGSALTASLAAFSAEWTASGQVPQRAIDSGLIDRFGAIDDAEGGATSRTTAMLRYDGVGAAPTKFVGSFTDYRFRLYSNFTFYDRDPARGDMIEQTDRRSIFAAKAERLYPWNYGGVTFRTRLGADLRSDNITVGLYDDSVRTRVATRVDAAIEQRHLGPYAEQEVLFDRAQVNVGLRVDYLTYDVVNRLTLGGQPDGVADDLKLSPRANLAVPLTASTTVFVNSGFGFHSNDARAVVGDPDARTMPRAFGSELGLRFGLPTDLISGSAAAWMLDLESELVYVGDEGVTEGSGRTRRRGVDLEARVVPASWLTLGAEATFSRGRFRDEPEGDDHIPLAPTFTLSANAVARWDALAVAARLRAVDDRPANESDTVEAKGYELVDLSGSYRLARAEVFANLENLFDVEWNEAQFDTQSRLRDEPQAVSELHFTPGTPRRLRAGIAYRF